MTDFSQLPDDEQARLLAMSLDELYGEILAVRRDRDIRVAAAQRDRDMWADVADQMFEALKKRGDRAGGESPTPPAPPQPTTY